MASDSRIVALLRGVNVGGRHVLPMAGLRACLEQAGCTDVETYIQSGNVVATVPAPERRRAAAWLAGVISAHAGFEVPVVARSAKELCRLVTDVPFATDNPKLVHATFFGDARSAVRYLDIALDAYEPERAVVLGSTVVFWLPNGLGRSPLVIDLERRAKRERLDLGTMRNWNTIRKLVEMADAS